MDFVGKYGVVATAAVLKYLEANNIISDPTIVFIQPLLSKIERELVHKILLDTSSYQNHHVIPTVAKLNSLQFVQSMQGDYIDVDMKLLEKKKLLVNEPSDENNNRPLPLIKLQLSPNYCYNRKFRVKTGQEMLHQAVVDSIITGQEPLTTFYSYWLRSVHSITSSLSHHLSPYDYIPLPYPPFTLWVDLGEAHGWIKDDQTNKEEDEEDVLEHLGNIVHEIHKISQLSDCDSNAHSNCPRVLIHSSGLFPWRSLTSKSSEREIGQESVSNTIVVLNHNRPETEQEVDVLINKQCQRIIMQRHGMINGKCRCDITSDIKEKIGRLSDWRTGYLTEIVNASINQRELESNVGSSHVIKHPDEQVEETIITGSDGGNGGGSIQQEGKETKGMIQEVSEEETFLSHAHGDKNGVDDDDDDDDKGDRDKGEVLSLDAFLFEKGCACFERKYVEHLKLALFKYLRVEESVHLWRVLQYMCTQKNPNHHHHATTMATSNHQASSNAVASPTINTEGSSSYSKDRKLVDMKDILVILGAMSGNTSSEQEYSTLRAISMLKKFMMYGLIEAVPTCTMVLPLLPSPTMTISDKTNHHDMVSREAEQRSNSSRAPRLPLLDGGEGENFQLSLPPPVVNAFVCLMNHQQTNPNVNAIHDFHRIIDLQLRWSELVEDRKAIDDDAIRLVHAWNKYYQDRTQHQRQQHIKTDKVEPRHFSTGTPTQQTQPAMATTSATSSTSSSSKSTSSSSKKRRVSEEEDSSIAINLDLVQRELSLLQTCSTLAMRRKTFATAVDTLKAEKDDIFKASQVEVEPAAVEGTYNEKEEVGLLNHHSPAVLSGLESMRKELEDGLSFINDIKTEEIVRGHVLSTIESRNLEENVQVKSEDTRSRWSRWFQK